MKKRIIHYIIVLSAIVPATILLVVGLILMVEVLSNFDTGGLKVIMFFVGGILGYLGLVMLLFPKKNNKFEFLNLLFLGVGIISFIIFNSLIGETNAWKWIFTMEEPEEWFFYVWPVLVASIYFVINGKELITR